MHIDAATSIAERAPARSLPERLLGPLRIVVHDYAGHPFQFELSAELARRGHAVQHLYFAENPTPQADDGKDAVLGYGIRALSLGRPFRKYSLIRRRIQEAAYGRLAAEAVAAFQPDVVLSANAPIDAQRHIHACCERLGIPVVLWLQDVVSVAMTRVLSNRVPLLGGALGRYYQGLEADLLRRSAAVVAVTEHFRDVCGRMGVPAGRLHVIENWAPLGEIRPVCRRNPWSDQHGLSDKLTLLYSGTLGFKHDPTLFERLAVHFRDRPDVRIVVVSEGPGASWLAERKALLDLDNLLLFPFQPYGRLSEVLGSGDVLLAVLEAEAGTYSVPSKVLSYLNARRPVLGALPSANLAAETIRRAKGGRTVDPADTADLIAEAESLLADSTLREDLGNNARAYAEAAFGIAPICDRFEAVLSSALAAHP